jgi:hypothetical protein
LSGILRVYGPNSDVECQLLWEELAGLTSRWDIPWCIGNDFNVSCFPSERLGASSSLAMEEFLDFIFE